MTLLYANIVCTRKFLIPYHLTNSMGKSAVSYED